MTAAARHNSPDPARRGYSLAELVLALGVLAIGMTMAAALFPTAIKLNELSTRDSIGTIVAANGLAIARSVLRTSDFGLPTDPNYYDLKPLDGATGFQGNNQYLLQYPADPNAVLTTRGYLPLGRPLNGTYQLVIVSYDKYSPSNSVTAEDVTVSVDPNGVGGATAVTLTPKNLADCKGAPLICVDGSAVIYARITDGNGNTGVAMLDHEIGNPTKGVLIVEAGGQVKKSPVMTVLVAETTLESGP